MGRNSSINPKLNIGYKISHGRLQLRLSWSRTRLIDELKDFKNDFEKGLLYQEYRQKNPSHTVKDIKRYEPLYISTGISITSAGDWDKENKKLMEGASIFQPQLDFLIKQIERLFDYLVKTDKVAPTVEVMRMGIKEFVKPRHTLIPTVDELEEKRKHQFVINGRINKAVVGEMPLVEYIEAKCTEWLKFANKKRQKFSSFAGLVAFIKLWQEQHSNQILKVKHLSEDFLIDFFHFITFSDDEITYKLNYINKIFRQFRTFGYAIRDNDKFPLTINWKNDAFPRFTEETDELALTMTQVMQVHQLQLPDHKTGYKNVKAQFTFGCLTGLRYSDLKRANVEHVRGKWMVKMTMKKTRQQLSIPLHPLALSIWNEFKDDWGVGNEVDFNGKVKDICKWAGISEDFQYSYTNTKTTELDTVTVPQYDMVYSSTCRRTFATLLVHHYNLNPEMARRFTGHKKLTSFLKYLRLSDKEVEDMLTRKFEGDADNIQLN